MSLLGAIKCHIALQTVQLITPEGLKTCQCLLQVPYTIQQNTAIIYVHVISIVKAVFNVVHMSMSAMKASKSEFVGSAGCSGGVAGEAKLMFTLQLLKIMMGRVPLDTMGGRHL